MTYSLPESTPPAVRMALSRYNRETQEWFINHLIGGTSANWLSEQLKKYGTPVSPTTLKETRRRYKEAGLA